MELGRSFFLHIARHFKLVRKFTNVILIYAPDAIYVAPSLWSHGHSSDFEGIHLIMLSWRHGDNVVLCFGMAHLVMEGSQSARGCWYSHRTWLCSEDDHASATGISSLTRLEGKFVSQKYE